MAYIIADPCVSTCDTACVEVCPVDCIHGPDDKEGAGAEAKESGFDPTDKQLYIDPEECIDCGACEPECPVEAIFEEDAVYYLYNPFGEKIIKFFLDKINSKHFIIYNNPVHLNTFLDNNYEIVKNNYDVHPNLDWVILRKKNLI